MKKFQIDNNETEIKAMQAFAKGDSKRGEELQKKFIEQFNLAIQKG